MTRLLFAKGVFHSQFGGAGGPTTGGGGREEEVPIAGESPREAESLDSKLAVERSDSSAQGRGDDLKGRSEEGRLDNGAIPTDATSIKDGATLAQEKTPEPHTNEPSSLGGFGGIAADGGLSRERRMRPPDFRSILQGDNEPAPSQGQQGGLVLKPLDSLNGISGSGNGSNMQADTSNAFAGGNMISSLPPQHDSASVPALRPLEPHTNEPSSLGGFGGIAADGGLSRERRMRPPDFRSILQGDNEPAPSQGQQGGLVLKPLDSLNGISGSGNGSNMQADTSNAFAGGNMISSLPPQHDSASVPALRPLEPHTNEPSSFGGFGGIAADGGLNRERRMRPPDFRSILQGDNEPAPSQGQQGGLVLKLLDSLNGISGSGNGSNMQADTSNAFAGGNMISSLPPQHDSASVPALRPLEPHTNEPSSLGGFGGIAADGGLNRERRMRPPDFRSILQGDNEPAPSQGQQGGLVLKPLDSLNGISGSGNGSNMQADTSNAFAGGNMISSLPPQHDSASVPALRPLEPHTNEPSSLGGFGGIAADGGLSRERRMRPPDFRSIQQGDNEPAPSQGQQGGLVLKPLDSLNRISGSGNGSIPGLQAMAGESKPIGLVTDTSASPLWQRFAYCSQHDVGVAFSTSYCAEDSRI